MAKNILLPTDFSDNAWSAAVYALKLYADEECTFYFLHSSKIKASAMSNITNRLLRVMTENAKRDLAELKEMAEKANTNASHNFETILSSEDLHDSIKRTIAQFNIDLVVMGTKGATKAKEILFGSNTVNVFKKIKECPVLVVPDEYDFETPKQIVFPTDFNRFYGEELISLKRLAELHNSKIKILHINEENNLSDIQNYNFSMLKAYLEDYPHTFHWMPDYAKKSQAINEFIEELGINILAIINYKHSFIENIIKEPVLKKIGFHPTVPFLVIPGSE
ncbi:MAG: universal stress protein [Winogradskyella sp.]|uniref:universal stress protein n=1 Tax=Winogradskyella sp. TaxID=1883156 RepID=UPI000F3D5D22|nr:universal stress protein [Winogradskyella sp.]RNC87750.1 MAG: universal stress protein [Winogradskyella sp.]